MNKFRNLLLLIFDIFLVITSYFLAVWIRFDFSLSQINYYITLWGLLPLLIITYIGVFKVFKTDKTLWSNPGVSEALRIAYASFVGVLLFAFFIHFVIGVEHLVPIINFTSFTTTLFGYEFVSTLTDYNGLYVPVLVGVARSTHLIALFIMILSMTFVRFTYRIYRLYVKRFSVNDQTQRAIIVGAGQAGKHLLEEIVRSSVYEHIKVIGFIDDDKSKLGRYFSGYKILASTQSLQETVLKHGIDVIYVAIPSSSIARQQEIIQAAYQTKAKVFTLKGTTELLSETGVSKNIKEIDIVDLLGRKEIVLDNDKIDELINDKVILITGAAGSIGSELSRQVLSYKPKKCILIDINENALYDLQQTFYIQHNHDAIFKQNTLFYTYSINDAKGLDQLFQQHHIDILFHAAAHKHVPFMEDVPFEAIYNNVLGSYNVFKLAHQHQVGLVVSVSTDKAINPTNIMGASKRLVEMMAQAFGQVSKTKFVSVRFGNVLGSNGSVIPLFKKQIEAGGPVLVTHKDMIRYFMLIPEAVSLILQAATFGDQQEIYILDMGQPVSILSLAENMIQLAGFKPHIDIPIEFTGLRPGEKLFEELLTKNESFKPTSNNLIFIVQAEAVKLDEIEVMIAQLHTLLDQETDKSKLIQYVQSIIPTYVSNG